jgi:MFS family permease
MAGRLYDRTGPRALVAAGALSFGLALLWMAVVLSKQSYPWIVPAYLAIGVGIGFVTVPITTDALNSAPTIRHGQASGVFATVSEMGGTLGLAILDTIVAVVQQAKIDAFLRTAGVRANEVAMLEHFLAESTKGTPSEIPRGLPPNTFQMTAAALTSATADAYYVAGIVMLAAATIGWLALRSQAESSP